MADKEVLYRIEFEGAKEQLKVLADIREELDKIAVEQVKSDKSDKVRQEELKIAAKQQQEAYRKEQQAIKDKAKENKAVSGTLEQLRLEAKRLGKELEKTWAVGTPEFKKAADGLEQINRKIQHADKSAGNFKSNIGNYAGSIGDAFQGIGVNVSSFTSSLGAASMATGPLGIGMVALAGGAQLFGKALTATDDLADKFERTMQSAKAATEVFFKALSTGDFSNLLGNMKEAIRLGAEYADTLDRLEDKKRSQDILDAKSRITILALQKELRNVNLTNDERIAKAQEILRIEDENATRRVTNAKILVDAESKKTAGLNKLSQEQLKDIVENYDAYEAKFEIVAKLTDAETRLKKEILQSRGFADQNKEVKRLQETVDSLRKSTAGYSEQIKAFGSVTAAERDAYKEALVGYYNEVASFDENTMRTESRLNTLIKSNTDESTKSAKIATSNIASVTAELQKLRDEAISAYAALLLIAATLAGGAAKNIEASKKGEKFKPQRTDKSLNPTERKSGYKVNLGEDEQAGFDINATVSAASQFASIWSSAYDQRADALKESLDKGLISEKKYQAESEKLQKKQANMQRIATIAQLSSDLVKTLSSLGVGAAKTAAIGFPANIPFMLAFAAQALGIVQNMRALKFAEGGLIAGGQPHSSGGTTYVGSDGQSFEAERDEYIAIVNKHDTRRLGDLSNLNSRHGKSFYNQPQSAYFAQGGVFTPNQNIGGGNSEAMIRDMVRQIGSIPVEVSLDEIQRKTNTKRKVNVIGSL